MRSTLAPPPAPRRPPLAAAGRRILLVAGLAAAAGAATGAADWPQYRGPGRDGRSTETGLLTEWPEAGPEVVWRVPLGDGYSGVAVKNGRAFTLFGSEGQEQAGAFDAATGRLIWRVRTDRNWRDAEGNGPRASPAADDERVYVLGAKAKLYALAADSGEVRWSYDLRKEFGARVPEWGFAASPLLEEDLVIVDAAGKKSHGVIAFRASDGRVVWHGSQHSPGYSSPVAVTIAGVRQVVAFSAQGLVSVATVDGRRLWHAPWVTTYDVNAAMPVFVPNNGIFVSSGYGTGAALLQIVREEDRFAVYQVWRSTVMRNDFNSSVLVGDHLYGFDGTTLKCIDALTGKQRWRASGYGKGSLLYADGHLLVLGGSGRLGLVEATPEAFREKGRAKILDGLTWTMPALSDGLLFARNHSELVAVRVGTGDPATSLPPEPDSPPPSVGLQ